MIERFLGWSFSIPLGFGIRPVSPRSMSVIEAMRFIPAVSRYADEAGQQCSRQIYIPTGTECYVCQHVWSDASCKRRVQSPKLTLPLGPRTHALQLRDLGVALDVLSTPRRFVKPIKAFGTPGDRDHQSPAPVNKKWSSIRKLADLGALLSWNLGNPRLV